MNNRNSQLSLLLIFLLFQTACKIEPPTDLAKKQIIPRPVSVAATGESFEITGSVEIYFQNGIDDLKPVAEYLSAELKRIGQIASVTQATNKTPQKGIYLSVTNEDDELDGEGYKLIIDKKLISIKAIAPAGNFYGIQTLLQMIPVNTQDGERITIPTGTVTDFPEYKYRGTMLDVSRHFFEVEDVKRVIDYLAVYKMNALHLHLSDDQGWRIEIKSWPRLTEIGGSTEVGGGEGGFYTQKDYKEIVNYAKERQITIIPEIDMPGHTNAALASYPELNCNGKATDLYTGTEVGFSTLCTNKKITYKFIDDVVREISALTPGPWFHMGGDESHVTAHDDYVYFVNKVQKIVTSHGKNVMGWDEIANANLADNAVVQFWANAKNTKMGLEKGTKVLMSPAKKAYLDMKYDSTTVLGLNWAGYIEVDTAYIWNPATYVKGVTKDDILGIEAPLWAETVTNLDEVEYMLFPRLPGYAEIGWTTPELRNWDDYKLRLAAHGKRFEKMGIDFYRSKLITWEE